MANTFVKIQTVTVGSGGAGTIDFTSIPQTYTDLKIVISSRSNLAGQTSVFGAIRFNGSSASIYSDRSLAGSGINASSSSNSANNFAYAVESSAASATASVFGNSEIYIPNYTSANNKSFSHDGVAETNASTVQMALSAGLWANTAAITSITLFPGGGSNFVEYSTATLYGIKSS